MTITILWWHFPALVTAVWFVYVVHGWLAPGSAWDAMHHGLACVFSSAFVLAVWVAAMAWRIAA